MEKFKAKNRRNVFKLDTVWRDGLRSQYGESMGKVKAAGHFQTVYAVLNQCAFRTYDEDGQVWITLPKEQFVSQLNKGLEIAFDQVRVETQVESSCLFSKMVEKGVVKITPLIEFSLEERLASTRKEAVKFIAERFGINPSTQSVYLGNEYLKRQEEKSRPSKRGNEQWRKLKRK